MLRSEMTRPNDIADILNDALVAAKESLEVRTDRLKSVAYCFPVIHQRTRLFACRDERTLCFADAFQNTTRLHRIGKPGYYAD